jgi:hypothetical protein
MIDFKTDPNNNIKEAVKLQLRFPVAEIERATKENKVILVVLNNKKPVSDNFFKHLAVFKIDLREFGYTKGLTRLVEKKTPPIKDEGLKDKMIALLENRLKRVESLNVRLKKISVLINNK